MATVTARQVDDEDYALLRGAAERNGRSVSEELRLLIAEHANRQRAQNRVAEVKKLRDRIGLTLPPGMTSLDLLREERGSW